MLNREFYELLNDHKKDIDKILKKNDPKKIHELLKAKEDIMWVRRLEAGETVPRKDEDRVHRLARSLGYKGTSWRQLFEIVPEEADRAARSRAGREVDEALVSRRHESNFAWMDLLDDMVVVSLSLQILLFRIHQLSDEFRMIHFVKRSFSDG